MMKFRFPWYIRFSALLVGLNGVPIYLYMNPYFFFGGYQKLTSPHHKGYENVHFKKVEDVQVHTKESEQLYNQMKEGDFRVPLYANFPSGEEIKEHGLFVIGRS